MVDCYSCVISTMPIGRLLPIFGSNVKCAEGNDIFPLSVGVLSPRRVGACWCLYGAVVKGCSTGLTNDLPSRLMGRCGVHSCSPHDLLHSMCAPCPADRTHF